MMNEPKRRLHLPSLNPQGRTNGDDNATQSSSSTDRSDMHRLKLAGSTPEEHTVTSLSTTTSKSDRVLRYGETVDSLFCLDGNNYVDETHRKLCESICAEKCNDAASWSTVLMRTISSPTNEVSMGERFITLLRRAASRFKLSDVAPSSHDDVLTIWLSYALILLVHDSIESAKDTYRHIQRIMYADESADFNLALFGNELEDGIEILQHSIQGGDKTMIDIIQQQLGELKQRTLLLTKCSRQKIALPSLSGKSSAVKNEDNDTTDIQSKPKSTLSSLQIAETMDKEEDLEKRMTIQTSKRGLAPSSTEDKASSYRAKLESRKKLRTDRVASRSNPNRKEVSISAILSQTMDDGESDDDESTSSKNQLMDCDKETKNIIDSTTPESNNDHNLIWPKSNVLTSSAPGSDQARKHFIENISPIDGEGTASIKDMDLRYLLNWDPSKRSTKKKVTIIDGAKDKIREEKKVAAPKITRNDLGYMMNWEPFPKQREGESVGKDVGATKPKSRAQNDMSMIEEEVTEVSATAGGENGITANSGSSCSLKSERDMTDEQERGTPIDSDTSSKSQNASRDIVEKCTASQDLPQVEQSFLPLIENNNIIKVDNEPYAKLGVIGKGGSCKVYRALSRECDVVALKKVKLDGLNKQAIDGYANEIALLKRLKGNPAIIQLYSSEVDLVRKSIYLVMELGEVDLNYVLRQQELLSSKQGRGTGRSNLNMNFIRLTWQQMLSAVHSIHEERIVHSDLKPANFLFVRGALKLIDFGIAKAIESHDTTNVYRETLSGTLSYMSPEAIMDTSTNANGVKLNKCGRASDIWSLGCILYQMVYGKTPFADYQGIPQKVLAITNPNHVINFPDDVDEAAIDAMKLCLERNPKLRGTIVGNNGLLNEHIFLHSRTRK